MEVEWWLVAHVILLSSPVLIGLGFGTALGLGLELSLGGPNLGLGLENLPFCLQIKKETE